MTKKIAIIYKILFFAYLISLVLLMVLTFKTDQMDIPKHIFGIPVDKVVHFILFFPYPILTWLTFNDSLRKKIKNLTYVLIPISGLFLATITETIQLLNSSRSYDPKDLMANYIAILSGSLLITIISLFSKKYSVKT